VVLLETPVLIGDAGTVPLVGAAADIVHCVQDENGIYLRESPLGYGATPDSPTLTVTTSGGTATFTIAGSTAGSANAVYIRVATTATWNATATVTITGDGSASAALDPGPYLAKVQSTVGDAMICASNEPVLFYVVDPDAGYTRSAFGTEVVDCMLPELLENFGEAVTYRRGIEAVSLSAIQGDVLMVNDQTTGIDMPLGDASWEIAVDDLDFGAGSITPRVQDQIITTTGSIFVVVEPGTLDSEQVMWTIPVKRVDYKEL
jgi:hypothetical protein